MSRKTDVVIIGGGPAGLAAGIYTSRLGLDTILLEKTSLGGQVSVSPFIENYLGFILSLILSQLFSYGLVSPMLFKKIK